LLSPAAFVAVNVTTLAANEQHITVVSRVGLVELGEHLTFFSGASILGMLLN